jgi:ribonuclease T2
MPSNASVVRAVRIGSGGRSSVGRFAQAIAVVAFALAAALAAPAADARSRREREPAVAGRFDYYVLSLSWSPSYCLYNPQDRVQCGGRGYGFVVHGLWPQYDAGGWPEDCGGARPPDAEALRIARSVFVTEKLLQHEWRKHGTCTGLDAAGYFRAVDRAAATVRIPARFEAPRGPQSLTASDIAAEFRRANPGVPPDALTVACGRGQLSEVRVCLTRDLKPRACARDVRTRCPRDPVEVRAVR